MLEDLGVYFADEGEDGVLDGEPVRVLFGAPGAAALAAGAAMGLRTDKPRALIEHARIPPRAAAPDADPVLELPGAPLLRPWEPVVRWRVIDIEVDGTGMASLILSKHADQG